MICDKCFGHYYFENTLELLFNDSIWKEEKENSNVFRSPLLCPKCKKQMKLHKFSEKYNAVEIDICSDCKILWLDFNEIEDLKLNKKVNKNTLNKTKNTISNTEINYILSITKLDEKLKEAKNIKKAPQN
nr:zf-TFIIB domain-containing protein [Leptospira congkakensis]